MKYRILVLLTWFLTLSKPRAESSEDDEDEMDPVFPGPVCISCSGVDNDPLVWCSGCGEPHHYDVSKITEIDANVK